MWIHRLWRSAIFVRLVKSAYLDQLGAPGASRAWTDAVDRGVLAAINEVELYTVFGGYEQFLAAPRAKVARATLVLMGKMEADQERAEEIRRNSTSSAPSSAYR